MKKVQNTEKALALISFFIQGCVVYYQSTDYIWMFIPSFFIADFFSGWIHWFFDSYQYVGYEGENIFLKTISNQFKSSFEDFQNHHHDPREMTRRSVWTNLCDSHIPMFVVYPFYLAMSQFWISFVNTVLIFLGLTNVFHRWSHCSGNYFPISFLQNYNLILSKKRHAVHHGKQQLKGYCITNGSMNGVLDSIHYWEYVELVVYYATGRKSYRMMMDPLIGDT